MRRTLCATILGLCVAAPALAAEHNHAAPRPPEPYRLSAAELDNVTAGIILTGITAALAAGGTFGLAETGGGGSSTQTPLPGGGFVESGVVGGTAAAMSTGGGSAASGASTSGSTNGVPLVVISGGGTVNSPLTNSSTSVSFTFVSGGVVFMP
ncbi:MAG TPA: hypothetical protein VKY65_14360 [Alphaproteobacteria bacterium]|nr:hypothetical protein [Alphaproteobacteria bacterium]